MATWKCNNCGTITLINHLKKCFGCGSERVTLISGTVKE